MPAPMPGTVLKVLVNVGDTVSENQPLLIFRSNEDGKMKSLQEKAVYGNRNSCYPKAKL